MRHSNPTCGEKRLICLHLTWYMAESNMLAYVMMRLWYSNPLFSYTNNLNFECCYRTCWHIQEKKKKLTKKISIVFFWKIFKVHMLMQITKAIDRCVCYSLFWYRSNIHKTYYFIFICLEKLKTLQLTKIHHYKEN